MADYDEEEVIVEEEPKPGLLILDMTNDDMKGISTDIRDAMIENCRQLALSDFFHVCVESKVENPKKFTLRPGGAQLVDTLKGMDHLNHYPRKQNESALHGTKILETFQSIGITHVCVCGTSTESSVLATAKDLVGENFQVFVVKDATYSKDGADGHELGLSDITMQIGSDVIVIIDDLLGDDQEIEEEIVQEADEYIEQIVEDEINHQVKEDVVVAQTPAPAPAPSPPPTKSKAVPVSSPISTTPSVPVKDLRVKTFIPTPKEVQKAPGPMTDAEKAEEMRRRDAEKLAARKAKFDAARFAHIENANTKAQDQAVVFQKRLEEKKIHGAQPYHPSTTYQGLTPAPPITSAKINETPQNQRKGWKLFHKKEVEPSSTVSNRFTQLKPPPPIAARSVKPAGPIEVTPGWASIEKTKERPRPQVHSSEPYYPVPASAAGLAAPPAPVPPAFKKQAELDKSKYQTVGYGTQSSGGVKPQMPGVNVSGSISTLQGNGLKTKLDGPRRMKTAKVTVDTKESFDAYGNLVRTITRNITEPDGTKRSETEVIEIAKKK